MTGLWRSTTGHPVGRAGAGMLAASAAVLLAFAWWPTPERYEPIRPYERGTILDVAAVPLAAIGQPPPVPPAADGGEILTVLPSSEPLPTEAEPALAVVLIPTDSAAPDGGTEPDSGTSTIEPTWVFPFNEPLPPEPGDNQALAVNTTDNSVTYRVAIAMVWVTDEDPVLNVNEAYAFASCSDCVTVAVAFQAVMIVGSANVIVPQNLSGALNYDCFQCITAAIASQLVVTVDALPSIEEQIALADLWEEIAAFAASIPTLPLADIISQFEDYKEQILTILDVAPIVGSASTALASDSPTLSPTAIPEAAPSADGSSSATPLPSTSPESSPPESSPPESSPPTSSPTAPTPSDSPSPEPTPSPTPSSTSEPTTSPEPSPSPSGGLSPEPSP